MKIIRAESKDIAELYKLQLLAFESEAEMIGSRDVPALQETEEDNRKDFKNRTVLKLVGDDGSIIGAIRYKEMNNMIDVGRLMVHPDYRHRGFAQMLLSEVDAACPNKRKELYTCTKSWSNILLCNRVVEFSAKPADIYRRICLSVVIQFVFLSFLLPFIQPLQRIACIYWKKAKHSMH